MAHVEMIAGAFLALGKTADAAVLAEGGKLRAPARENLVGIGLMSHVPHDAVIWRIEGVVQRDGQVHNAQTRCKVPTRLRHHLDDLPADLLRERGQFFPGEGAQVITVMDLVENHGYLSEKIPKLQIQIQGPNFKFHVLNFDTGI